MAQYKEKMLLFKQFDVKKIVLKDNATLEDYLKNEGFPFDEV